MHYAVAQYRAQRTENTGSYVSLSMNARTYGLSGRSINVTIKDCYKLNPLHEDTQPIMAEIATKKSMNVVSSKKNEVCSVQSNNGLIDLDNITTSNSQLNSLCDDEDEDDLILANNTKNELNAEDKSLQELIERELALRICSSNEEDTADTMKNEESSRSEPEVKRIVLEPRPDPLDINSEFIIAEMDHYSLIEDPYAHQNGHVTPDLDSKAPVILKETIESEPVGHLHVEETFDNQLGITETTAIQQTTSHGDQADRQIKEDLLDLEKYLGLKEPADQEIVGLDDDDLARESYDQLCTMDNVIDDHFQVEEHDRSTDQKYLNILMEEDVDPGADLRNKMEHVNLEDSDKAGENNVDLLGSWNNQESRDNQVGQFSDNFEETLEQVAEDDKPSAIVHEELVQLGADVPALGDDVAPSIFEYSGNLEQLSVEEDQSRTFSLPEDETSTISEAKESSFIHKDTSEPISEDSQENQEILPAESSGPLLLEQSQGEELKFEKNSKHQQQNEINLHQDPEIQCDLRKFESESKIEIQEIKEVRHERHQESMERQEVFLTEKNLIDTKITESLIQSKTESTTSVENSLIEIIGTTEKTNSNVRVFSESKYADACAFESSKDSNDFESWTTVEDATTSIDKATPETLPDDVDNKEWQIVQEDSKHLTTESHGDDRLLPEDNLESVQDRLSTLGISETLAPLATPDDETSDISNMCDSENREEVITTSTVVTSSSSTTKSSTKTKKKKIEGVASSDASPTLTPRTKKTKKSKKSDPEKENISVCRSFGDLSNMSDGERGTHGHSDHEMDAQEKSSFNKFDALSKKTVLHVRSVDAGKVQQQLNAVGQNGDVNPNCRSCGKVVFQMEQTKAEGSVWHKNCFRCVQCSKQLNVDNYQSHESTLYCKAHFKELFQPKPVEESDQPMRPRKPEMIIRENQPKELPPDVVRASDKPDLGLEELSTLNVKSRFQVFEKGSTEATNDIERSPSQVAVKRSPSILSKLAKFQSKGMDIGVADESLNGIPFEESSESEEEIEESEEVDTEIVKAKRATRERPMSFSKMDDIKNRWESTSQQGRRESQREARKEEIAGIRSRLFMGKQGKMKEMYQQAVAESERVTKINPAEEIQHAAHTRSIKERFERGEPIAASDDETDSKPKQEKPDEEVIAAGISKKSRTLFLELDASAAKTGRTVTPVTPKTPATDTTSRRARDAFMGRQVSEDVVRSTDAAEEFRVETTDISNKFKFFEAYKEPEKQRKQFRITPPRDGQVKMDSPEREIYRDPDVVRAEDRVDEVVHTDTATKMLSIFRQMEENATKDELPEGPKPLKCFTPPPEDKFAKPTASESDEEDDEEAEESEGDDSAEERDPNYVRASDKVEDEFLKQAQNAARAKTLRAKFEHWEEADGKVSSHHVAEMEIAQGAGEQSSIESASSLRARFESLGSQTSESQRTPKVKVNRFVEIQTSCMEVCESCQKKVYPLEKVETNNKIFHKQCFRCLQCNCILRMDTFTLNNGKLYCIPHFKQLFITRGNYDEGFGVDPHKNKWSTNSSGNTTAPTPIAVSNGDL
ncbi:probable GPI-anchored adhesin-like protein PGA55 isoform X20 [Cephus cinctus]|uniref:Probable GPI-anchored adhesin-like protein PGA55 isoform X20 n=1 Tax=Cephus cinctus TaxID=211228 RepID=A0AAJ7RG89_CEPCN|nr:probable GPI-anchored adhesin-like protein PGA55 isoform X20 [Cephus cinctus]